jgi:hypothetical protein
MYQQTESISGKYSTYVTLHQLFYLDTQYSYRMVQQQHYSFKAGCELPQKVVWCMSDNVIFMQRYSWQIIHHSLQHTEQI